MVWKVCNSRGCNNLIPKSETYCKEHQELTKERHKDYKKFRKDIWEQRFYNSKRWQTVREIVKVRDNGLCQLCLNENVIKYLDTVHHIVELKEDRSQALSPNNLVCLCESCHQKVHKQYKDSKDKDSIKLKLRKIISE